MTKTALALAGVGLALSPAGVASGAAGATVRIKDIDFHPKRLVVSPGTRVTWRFLDQVASHTVTSVGKKRFKSVSARRTGSYSVTFGKRGTYRYVCTIHPNMKGRIVVK